MKEETLSLRQKYQTILTKLAPVGAMGVSLALGAAAPAAASTEPAQPTNPAPAGVSERLAAVRAAVSAIDEAKTADTGERVAWWGNGWGGGGWGWPNWPNWRNWGNWFHNW